MRPLLPVIALFTLFIQSWTFAAPPEVYIRSNRDIVVKGQSVSPSFFSGIYDLGDQLSSNALAQELYLKHRRQGVWGAVFNWGAVASSVTYAVVVDDFNAAAFWAIFLLPWFTGLIFAVNSQQNLVKAINVYNGISLDQAQSRPWSVSPVMAKADLRNSQSSVNGLGLGLAYRF